MCFDAELWETVIGAFLAALLGIITALWLDGRRSNREKLAAAQVVSVELGWMIKVVADFRDTALKNQGKVDINYSPLVPSNEFLKYRPLLVEILSESDFMVVANAYKDFSMLDTLMETAVAMQIQLASSPLSTPPLIRMRDEALGLYWGSLRKERTGERLTELKNALQKLQRKAK